MNGENNNEPKLTESILKLIYDYQTPIELFNERLENDNYSCIIPGIKYNEKRIEGDVSFEYDRNYNIHEIHTPEIPYIDFLKSAVRHSLYDYENAVNFEENPNEYTELNAMVSYFAPILTLISNDNINKCIRTCDKSEIDEKSTSMGLSKNKNIIGAACIIDEDRNIFDSIKTLFYGHEDPEIANEKREYINYLVDNDD